MLSILQYINKHNIFPNKPIKSNYVEGRRDIIGWVVLIVSSCGCEQIPCEQFSWTIFMMRKCNSEEVTDFSGQMSIGQLTDK